MAVESVQIEDHILPLVFGEYDSNIKKIESDLEVHIVNRDNQIIIKGSDQQAVMAKKILSDLSNSVKKGVELSESSVDYSINSVRHQYGMNLADVSDNILCVTPMGKQIRAKTEGQRKYMDAIAKKMIVFGVGPAGTGKTYLAMAHAITAFKKKEVNRIILTRPAIEAGEKLGFLPGDLQSKVDPYLRPLYDALYEIMGADSFVANMEKGLIEVAPLAYMRGRTLDNAFIVLDEAQNTTSAQMKMFLTRIGYGSKVVITGDITQKDLPSGQKSGLEVAMAVLRNIREIGICRLSNKDVVRHPLVQKIVEAYENSDVKKGKNHGQEK